MSGTDSDQWYREAFDEYYVDLYAHRDSVEATQFVGLLKGHVTLQNALVLDLACGGGRHMVALAEAGAGPVGLDLSPALLKRAAHVVRGPLIRGDMRSLPLSGGVLDGVISVFTSFGYFPELKDEMAALREVERCLKRGGWFVIDYMNASLVKRSLKSESRRKVGGMEVFERRSVTPGGDRVIKEIEIREQGGLVKRYRESVRLLDRDQLNAMLLEAGLEPTVLMGDYSGEEYREDDSPRMMALCKKT